MAHSEIRIITQVATVGPSGKLDQWTDLAHYRLYDSISIPKLFTKLEEIAAIQDIPDVS